MTITKGLKQAYDMQDFTYEAAMALKSTLTIKLGDGPGLCKPPDKEQAAMIGTLVKAWETAQERVRIARGKPLPGSLTHDKVRAGRAQRRLPTSVLADLATQVDEAEQPTPGADQGHGRPTTIGSSNG